MPVGPAMVDNRGMFDLDTWGLPVLVFVAAGTVKGLVGLGLPTVAMALLAQTMTPAAAAALLIVPSFVTNVWQLGPTATLAPLWRRLWPMQLGVCTGTWVGAWLLGAPAGAWATAAVGAALVLYAVWGLSTARFTVSAAHERWLGPTVGALTGLLTAATGVFNVPAVPYLQSLGIGPDELVQAMGISFTTSTVALAIGLYANESYSAASLAASMLMLPPALIGMFLGQRMRQTLSPSIFRTCFLIALLVLGAQMLARYAIQRW